MDLTSLGPDRMGDLAPDSLSLVVPPGDDQEDTTMCLNCGCGEPDERHQPTDITREDLQRAADGSGASLEQATKNMTASLEKLASTNRQESAAAPRSS
jgi:hypothetical protein